MYVSSFQGHAVTAKIVGAKKAKTIMVDGKRVKKCPSLPERRRE